MLIFHRLHCYRQNLIKQSLAAKSPLLPVAYSYLPFLTLSREDAEERVIECEGEVCSKRNQRAFARLMEQGQGQPQTSEPFVSSLFLPSYSHCLHLYSALLLTETLQCPFVFSGLWPNVILPSSCCLELCIHNQCISYPGFRLPTKSPSSVAPSSPKG